MPYAELEDLQVRFPRTLTSNEEERAEILLEDASFQLGVRAPGLQEAIDGGDEQLETAAKLTVVAMVRRVLLAPALDDGVQSQNLVTGPFQQQIVYRNPDSNLYLYQAELDTIRGLLRPNPADAVSVMQLGL